MTILLANWELILFALLLLAFLFIKAKQFLTHPTEKRQELILMWLIEAVAIAEKQYGSKTGQLKLSFVYTMFVDKFGILATLVSKELFETLVDRALRIMEETFKDSLKSNPL